MMHHQKICSGTLKQILVILFSSFLFNSCSNNEQPTIESIDFTGNTRGCVNFQVWKVKNEDEKNIVLSIQGASKEELGLTSEFLTITIPNESIQMEILEWSNAFNGCDDFFPPNEKIDTWKAISGKVHISISDITLCHTTKECYDIFLQLENIIFSNPEGKKLSIDSLELKDVFVGWMPG